MSESQIYIDTSTLDSSRAEDVTVFIGNAIQLPSLNYEIALTKLVTFYSQNNISAQLGNNTLAYSTDGGLNFQLITIPDGVYSIELLDATIKEQMVANGHVRFDTKGRYVYDIILGVEYSTGRVYWDIYDNYVLDLTTSDLNLLLGFVKTGYYGVTSNDYDRFYNTGLVDLNNGVNSWQVRCSLADNSFFNGNRSDILFNFIPSVAPYTELVEEPHTPSYTQLNTKTIDKITLRLTDQSGRLLDLGGQDIQYTITIRPIK